MVLFPVGPFCKIFKNKSFNFVLKFLGLNINIRDINAVLLTKYFIMLYVFTYIN